MPECIFCRIVADKTPARRIYEDEELLAFDDLNPKAPVHILIIPKKHIPSVLELKEEDRSGIAAASNQCRDRNQQFGGCYHQRVERGRAGHRSIPTVRPFPAVDRSYPRSWLHLGRHVGRQQLETAEHRANAN